MSQILIKISTNVLSVCSVIYGDYKYRYDLSTSRGGGLENGHLTYPSLDRNANLHNYLILKSTILDYIVVRSISVHKLIHCRPS